MVRKVEKRRLSIAVAAVVLLVLLPGVGRTAQDKPKRENFQAVAMGQSTQMGQLFNVDIRIEEYSTPEDQQILLEAFTWKVSPTP